MEGAGKPSTLIVASDCGSPTTCSAEPWPPDKASGGGALSSSTESRLSRPPSGAAQAVLFSLIRTTGVVGFNEVSFSLFLVTQVDVLGRRFSLRSGWPGFIR